MKTIFFVLLIIGLNILTLTGSFAQQNKSPQMDVMSLVRTAKIVKGKVNLKAKKAIY